MAEQTISAKITSGEHKGKEASVTYDFGDDLTTMTDLFGEKVVFSNARQQFVIGAQDLVRRSLKSNKDPQEAINSWKPGMARARRSRVDKLKSGMEEASLDELKEINKAIKEQIARAQAAA